MWERKITALAGNLILDVQPVANLYWLSSSTFGPKKQELWYHFKETLNINILGLLYKAVLKLAVSCEENWMLIARFSVCL